MGALMRQCQFEVSRMMKNRAFLFFSLMMPLAFYFIFVNVDGANMRLAGTTWKTYFLMSMAAYSVLGSSIFGLSGRVSFERTQGWLRLVRTTPLPNYAYVAAKCLSQLIISFFSIMLLFIVGALTQGVSLVAIQWTVSLLWLTIGSLPFVAIGLFIGVVFGNEATAIVCNILNMALGILGGLWWPIKMMPHIMQTIAQYTPTYRFADVAWQVIAGKSAHASDLAVLAGYLALFVAATLMVLRRKQEQQP